jgi:hypothetical protein
MFVFFRRMAPCAQPKRAGILVLFFNAGLGDSAFPRATFLSFPSVHISLLEALPLAVGSLSSCIGRDS